jgi:hypothetical protein
LVEPVYSGKCTRSQFLKLCSFCAVSFLFTVRYFIIFPSENFQSACALAIPAAGSPVSLLQAHPHGAKKRTGQESVWHAVA